MISCEKAETFIKKIENESQDLIFIDPPYEINYQKLKWDSPDIIDWEYLIKDFYRVLKPNGQMLVMCGWSNYPEVIKNYTEQGFYLKNSIVWDRVKGRGAKTNLMSTREEILWFVKNPKKYTYNRIYSTTKKKTIGLKSNSIYRSLSNVWTDISPLVPWGKEKKLWYHPTQKPYKLSERIVTIWSNEGDNVTDFFMGTGVTAEVCKNLKRNFNGCDKTKIYYDKAIKRLGN